MSGNRAIRFLHTAGKSGACNYSIRSARLCMCGKTGGRNRRMRLFLGHICCSPGMQTAHVFHTEAVALHHNHRTVASLYRCTRRNLRTRIARTNNRDTRRVFRTCDDTCTGVHRM